MEPTLLLILASVASAVIARPVATEEGKVNNGTIDRLSARMLDDIRLVPGQLEQTRNAIPTDAQLWPNGQIPYVIHSKLQSLSGEIKRAIGHFHTLTCLRFVPKQTYHQNYIQIIKGDGCYSDVGMINEGAQPVSLGPGCEAFGTIVHELSHAIGFYDEHNRSDRDDHLKINWDNIDQSDWDQFQKLQPYQNRLLTAFDLTSIMINGNYAFAKDRSKPSMISKIGVPLTEPRDKPGLSPLDVIRIKKLYRVGQGKVYTFKPE